MVSNKIYNFRSGVLGKINSALYIHKIAINRVSLCGEWNQNTYLNPIMTVAEGISEPLRLNL